MGQVHIDEEVATLIAEALHSGCTYPQIKEKRFAKNANQIALVVKEMAEGKIIINQEGRAVIRIWDVVRHKEINQNHTSGKKNEEIVTDESLVTDIAGLGVQAKGIKAGGDVDTSDIIKTQSEYLSSELKLVLNMGIYITNIMRNKVPLSIEEARNPTLAEEKYKAWLNTNNLLSQDPHAFERLEIDVALAETRLEEANRLVTTLTAGWDAATGVMCADCQKRLYYAIVISSKAEKAKKIEAARKPTDPRSGIEQ